MQKLEIKASTWKELFQSIAQIEWMFIKAVIVLAIFVCINLPIIIFACRIVAVFGGWLWKIIPVR